MVHAADAAALLLGEWGRGNRGRRHLGAPVILIGTGRGADSAAFLRKHPQLGCQVAVVVELLPNDAHALSDHLAIVDSVGATGIVVADAGDPVVTVLLRTVTALIGQTLRWLLNGSEATLAPPLEDELIMLPEAEQKATSKLARQKCACSADHRASVV